GSGEELRRGAELDELPNEQERREVADARGLLHIVGDDSDGADVFQLHQQFFNFGSADGSSAEQGSSRRRTSGSTARARAMHKRCCWPPESSYADLWRWSLTSSQSAACRRLFSTASEMGTLEPLIRRP